MAVGRTPKLTADVQRRITEAMVAGNYFETSCRLAGIGLSTAYDWLQRGRGTHPQRSSGAIYVEFVEAVEKARAQHEISSVAQIKRAGQGGQLLYEKIRRNADGTETIERRYSLAQWQANAWILERQYPEKWGRKERKETPPAADEMPASETAAPDVLVIKVASNGNGAHA